MKLFLSHSSLVALIAALVNVVQKQQKETNQPNSQCWRSLSLLNNSAGGK
jgi:hypothetical protein